MREAVEEPVVPKYGGYHEPRSAAIGHTSHFALEEDLLGQLDITPVQVLIEARFIELTLTDLNESGFEWVMNKGLALRKVSDVDGSRGTGVEIASGGGSSFATLAREGEGLNLTLEGILTGPQFEAVLHALEESSKR